MKTSATSKTRFLKAFDETWGLLFSSPVHLDSALSKQPAPIKPWLAQFLPRILLAPVTLAESLGVGVAQGEPWSLSQRERQSWKAAHQMASRLYDLFVSEDPTPLPEIRAGQADFPPEIFESWRQSFGEKTALELVETLGGEAPLSLRAAQGLGPADLIAELKATELLPRATRATAISPLGVQVPRYAPLLRTECYEKGHFEIQDEGSQLMAIFALWPDRVAPYLHDKPRAPKAPKHPIELGPKPSGAFQAVDACAGAGGKSLALSDLLHGKGRIFAYDISEKKLLGLRRRATRGGYNNIQTRAIKDGEEHELVAKFSGTADLVLVDAPCSGWGVLRRNPDIKWREGSGLERLPGVQARLLSEYSKLAKKGGRVVYGACTYRPEETSEIVSGLLSTGGFELEAQGFLGPGPMDGFFMAALRKTR